MYIFIISQFLKEVWRRLDWVFCRAAIEVSARAGVSSCKLTWWLAEFSSSWASGRGLFLAGWQLVLQCLTLSVSSPQHGCLLLQSQQRSRGPNKKVVTILCNIITCT